MNIWTQLSKIQEAFATPSSPKEAIVRMVGELGWTVDNPEWLFNVDETGVEYIFIPYSLPFGVLAEVDDNTFGGLYGFRVYRSS